MHTWVLLLIWIAVMVPLSGHVRVSYGMDLIPCRPSVLVDVLFQGKFLFSCFAVKY